MPDIGAAIRALALGVALLEVPRHPVRRSNRVGRLRLRGWAPVRGALGAPLNPGWRGLWAGDWGDRTE